jgi:hypothetical protein
MPKKKKANKHRKRRKAVQSPVVAVDEPKTNLSAEDAGTASETSEEEDVFVDAISDISNGEDGSVTTFGSTNCTGT